MDKTTWERIDELERRVKFLEKRAMRFYNFNKKVKKKFKSKIMNLKEKLYNLRDLKAWWLFRGI